MPIYPKCSTLIQNKHLKNIIFSTVRITFLLLTFQIFTLISPLKVKALSYHISMEN
jgi:hypothetical protein